jgi:hypothetical protein
LADGQLRYQAPKGSLTQDDISSLKTLRHEIVTLFQGALDATAPETEIEARHGTRHAPLTFSQLQHCNLQRLHERKAVRQIASATRLRGCLHIGALRECLAEMVRRHDALRTRIVIRDGIPTQEIDEPAAWDLPIDDLTAVPKKRLDAEVKSLIEWHILEPIDLSRGPLFGARLLKLRKDEHVLVLAMEHCISDARSMGIFLRELLTAYEQVVTGRIISLPKIPVQFPAYAIWQQQTHPSRLAKHGPYWDAHLKGRPRLKFPPDYTAPDSTRSGWGTIPLQIGKELKSQLLQWCQLRRTTLVTGVLTAYAGLVLRWCNASEAIFQYATDGRDTPKIENTIGYFASVLYIPAILQDTDRFEDLLNRIARDYCTAYEHADFSYLEAQMPRPEFAHNSAFNWIPSDTCLELTGLKGTDAALTCTAIRFNHPMLRTHDRDNEPSLVLYDTPEEILGEVNFPRNRFSEPTMERFAQHLLMFLNTQVAQPTKRIHELSLL